MPRAISSVRTAHAAGAEMLCIFVVPDTCRRIRCAFLSRAAHTEDAETFVTSDFTFYFRLHASDFS